MTERRRGGATHSLHHPTNLAYKPSNAVLDIVGVMADDEEIVAIHTWHHVIWVATIMQARVRSGDGCMSMSW